MYCYYYHYPQCKEINAKPKARYSIHQPCLGMSEDDKSQSLPFPFCAKVSNKLRYLGKGKVVHGTERRTRNANDVRGSLAGNHHHDGVSKVVHELSPACDFPFFQI